jgi:hypothetical protein
MSNNDYTRRFIKLVISDRTQWLLEHYPNAMLLLMQIAIRARRTPNSPDGLEVGDAILGDHKKSGLTRQKYRTALEKLIEFNFIEIIYNGKKFLKRQKSTIKITITGTLVNLKDSSVFDINPELDNQHVNQLATNEQPTSNHKQERQERQEVICIKETSKEKSQNFARCLSAASLPFSEEKQEEQEVLEAYFEMKNIIISSLTIKKWLSNYSSDKITHTINFMLEKKELPNNPPGWIERALKGNWAQQAEFAKINKEFALKFKNENNVSALYIYKTYCKDNNTGIDYDYKMVPDIFQRHLEEKFG